MACTFLPRPILRPIPSILLGDQHFHVRVLQVVLARAPQHADREEAEEEEHVPSGLKRPEHCPPRVEAVGEYDEELGGDPHTGDDNEEEEDVREAPVQFGLCRLFAQQTSKAQT